MREIPLMIADREIKLSSVNPIAIVDSQFGMTRNRSLENLGWFLLFLAVVVVLQIASGAYRGEFSSYPDEPAHYVTSLMVRDYVLHSTLASPLHFAEDYYKHYPKVAFGHWPPLFYILQSAWMTLFSVSRASVRLEMAVTAAALAYAVMVEARRWFGGRSGVLAGLLTVCLPLVQDYSDQEMSEILLTLLCFWSAVYFSRYLNSERVRDSLLFGLFFSLAVLTKGSGWLLTLVPPIALLLTRRLRLLRQPSFWAPVALVFVTCVPWQLMTMRMADRGWDGGATPSVAYTLHSLLEFLGLFPNILGPLFLIFLLVGIGVTVLKPFWKGRVSSASASQFALLISVWIFHSLVPAGVEDRKLVIAAPSMILILFAGGRYLADRIPRRSLVYRQRYLLATLVGAATFLLTTFSIPTVHRYGFIETAGYLMSRPNLANSTILVSSESGGEGLLISEIAMLAPHPKDVILRGTKALSEVAWNGADYHSTYASPEAIDSYLQAEHVGVVVLDTFAPLNHFAHHQLLRAAVQADKHYALLATFPPNSSATHGQIEVYGLQRQ